MLAVALAAASLSAVPAAGPGDQVALVARDLAPAPGYRLALVAPRRRGARTTCLGRIGPRRPADAAETVFSGTLPRRLECLRPDGSRARTVRVRPGRRYVLQVAVPFPAEPQADTEASVVRRGIRVARPGRRCGQVAFTPQSDEGAALIRAARTTCRRARLVVRAGRDASGRCLERLRCRFTVRRFTCSGLTDESGLPSVVVRCTRGRARVTYRRS